MDRECSTHEAKRNVYMNFVENSEGIGPVGRFNLGVRIILKWILER
jgi:hypothetical protein